MEKPKIPTEITRQPAIGDSLQIIRDNIGSADMKGVLMPPT
jgi:hypothetical protein